MKQFYINISLLVSGILLFALPQPSFIYAQGLPFISYFSFIPIFILTRRLSRKSVWLYGMLYGIGCYVVFTSWLANFHPMGITVISFLYGVQLCLVFPLLKAAWSLWGEKLWIAQWIVWCAYEYLKTKGFAGFNYGVTAYSHWNVPVLIQCADIAGVWGLSALITFPSMWFAQVLYPLFEKYPAVPGKTASEEREQRLRKSNVLHIRQRVKKYRISALIWCVVFAAAIVYGFVSRVDYGGTPTQKVVLVQTNTDPWIGGTAAYRRDLTTLKRLTDKALAEHPDASLVVWPETAFIPRIRWHYRLRADRERFELVDELLHYMDSKQVPFVIGNDDTVEGYNSLGDYGEISYNAVLLFRPGENVIPPEPELYHKMHLVPFTEYFPFEKMFPTIYRLLLNGDTHMWTPGKEPVVFSAGDLRFGTPVCFEDTFGYIGRRYVNAGANALVNLSNDAWSKSLACQYQHLSMAVFRSVENRVPTVRATASGQTAMIDPNGKVCSMLEPFCEGYLAVSVPVLTKVRKTVYTAWGDYAGIAFACAAFFLLLFKIMEKMLCRFHTAKKKAI
ncbi:apolipoprotein N-acyltransferase [Treponema sp. HNW]|uniref:apolipoprotein N-acyltransferase n=1 Tax=Treponema sp. HNW TaxID=3116654 RepID=UPI003D10EE80